MSQLIPYEKRLVGTETIETVDGRDLHAFLEIARDYNLWMRRQIKRAGLLEHRDFTTYLEVGSSVRGGRKQIDYFLTLDASKHLSMLSMTPKGHEAREYFIACAKDCERRRQEQPESEGALLVRLAIAYERQEAQQRRLIQDMLALQAQTIANQAKTIEAHELAQTAMRSTIEAHELATKAVEAQLWMTLDQYRFIHGLQHQLSEKDLADFGRYLVGYCHEQQVTIYKAGVEGKRWSAENTYHVGTINALLPLWLARRYGQVSMDDVQ